METKFVVLTTNRSGSVWLMSTLSNLPRVTAQGELFLPRRRKQAPRWDSDFAIPRYIERERTGLSVRPFSIFAYLDALFCTPGIVGFKLMYAQLGRYPEILFYMMRHRLRVVHLIRRNHLDVLLSYAIKARIGQAHLLVGQAAPEAVCVELETATLLQRLQWLQRKQELARGLLRACRLPHMEIAYEELLHDSSHFRQIWNFLGIQPGEEELPHSNVTRSRKGRQRDVLGNYDEVSRLLARSKFAGLLE